MNGRQEDRLERIERLLADIRDLLASGEPDTRRAPPRRAGLRDLATASIDHVAALERDRREAERSNGWAPDSELSYRDQYERLERQVREYDRLVDAANGGPDDPTPSRRLPWNREQEKDHPSRERIRTAQPEKDRDDRRRSDRRERRYDPIP